MKRGWIQSIRCYTLPMYVKFSVEDKRALYMFDYMDTHNGLPHTVCRMRLYEDCITLYKEKLPMLIKEYPFHIAYSNERAVDTGGVSRDMFSAFRELAYLRDFDGGSTYVPVVHPHTDLSHYKVLGTILAHGFISTGFLPNRLAFPVIARVLLGFDIPIPDLIIIDSFVDYLSTYESSIIRDALKKKGAEFSSELKDSLLSVLGGMGCREIPNPSNIQQLIVEVAHYELTIKPAGALSIFHCGVPVQYHAFWREFSVSQLYDLYKALNVTPGAVVNAITAPDNMNANETRVYGYLKTFVGNLNHQDLRNFMRFVTGSSVMIDQSIVLTFNNVVGLARSPIVAAYWSYQVPTSHILNLKKSSLPC